MVLDISMVWGLLVFTKKIVAIATVAAAATFAAVSRLFHCHF